MLDRFHAGLVISSLIASLAHGQDDLLTARPMDVNSKIESVTLYNGRAAVKRIAAMQVEQGVWDLRFSGLPDGLQLDSLQARALVGDGPSIKVLGVDFEQRTVATAPSPAIAELDGRIREIRDAIARVEEQHKINASQGKFLDDLSVRATSDASKDAGTGELVIDKVLQLMKFIESQREALMTRRLELDTQKRTLEEQLRVLEAERNALAPAGQAVERTAIVSVVAPSSTTAQIELVYLVRNANWAPSYNIRAAADQSQVSIEYDAMIAQRSGEDWDDVSLTLSTAQPTVAANPPTLSPWYVDVYVPPPAMKPGAVESDAARVREPAAAAGRMLSRGGEAEGGALDGLSADAVVAGQGPSVTFTLPRKITIKNNAHKQQRTRIATIDAKPEFVHVAVPMATEAVYVRGELTNESAYQLLAGKAAIFFGQDYVGPTQLEATPPGGNIKVYFGIDQAVTTSRQLLSKNQSNTGLFGGGRRTTYNYRTAINNGTSRPITLELWDRIPVSRNEQIKIELTDLSRPLAADAEYLESQQPQGLLKWMLSVPANATSKNPFLLTYNVNVNRAKDVEMTPLPE